MESLQHLLNGALMSRIGGSSPAVTLDIQFLPKSQELFSDSLGELGRSNVFSLRPLLHLLAMLIDSNQQERRTLSSAVTDNDIGQDFLIGMPDVWRRVSIVDCRSNEVFHLIELTLKLHNKIAKVTNPNNFTTRSLSPRRQNNSQQGRKGQIAAKRAYRTRENSKPFGRPLLIPHTEF